MRKLLSDNQYLDSISEGSMNAQEIAKEHFGY